MPDSPQTWREIPAQTFSDDLEDERVRAVFAFWLRIRGANRVPLKSALDPIEIRTSLPIVWLLERVAPMAFRYRLAGEEVTRALGGITRGTDPADLFATEDFQRFARRWSFVLDRPCAMRAFGSVSLGDGRSARVERLMVPLAQPDGRVTLILGATHYRLPRHAIQGSIQFPPTQIEYTPVDAFADAPTDPLLE